MIHYKNQQPVNLSQIVSMKEGNPVEGFTILFIWNNPSPIEWRFSSQHERDNVYLNILNSHFTEIYIAE